MRQWLFFLSESFTLRKSNPVKMSRNEKRLPRMIESEKKLLLHACSIEHVKGTKNHQFFFLLKINHNHKSPPLGGQTCRTIHMNRMCTLAVRIVNIQ